MTAPNSRRSSRYRRTSAGTSHRGSSSNTVQRHAQSVSGAIAQPTSNCPGAAVTTTSRSASCAACLPTVVAPSSVGQADSGGQTTTGISLLATTRATLTRRGNTLNSAGGSKRGHDGTTAGDDQQSGSRNTLEPAPKQRRRASGSSGPTGSVAAPAVSEDITGSRGVTVNVMSPNSSSAAQSGGLIVSRASTPIRSPGSSTEAPLPSAVMADYRPIAEAEHPPGVIAAIEVIAIDSPSPDVRASQSADRRLFLTNCVELTESPPQEGDHSTESPAGLGPSPDNTGRGPPCGSSHHLGTRNALVPNSPAGEIISPHLIGMPSKSTPAVGSGVLDGSLADGLSDIPSASSAGATHGDLATVGDPVRGTQSEPPTAPEDCAVCFENLGTKETAHPDSCQHHFCSECLNTWATKTNLCPLCKQEFTSIVKDATGERQPVTSRRLRGDSSGESGSDEYDSESDSYSNDDTPCQGCGAPIIEVEFYHCRECEENWCLGCLSRLGSLPQDVTQAPECVNCHGNLERGEVRYDIEEGAESLSDEEEDELADLSQDRLLEDGRDLMIVNHQGRPLPSMSLFPRLLGHRLGFADAIASSPRRRSRRRHRGREGINVITTGADSMSRHILPNLQRGILFELLTGTAVGDEDERELEFGFEPQDRQRRRYGRRRHPEGGFGNGFPYAGTARLVDPHTVGARPRRQPVSVARRSRHRSGVPLGTVDRSASPPSPPRPAGRASQRGARAGPGGRTWRTRRQPPATAAPANTFSQGPEVLAEPGGRAERDARPQGTARRQPSAASMDDGVATGRRLRRGRTGSQARRGSGPIYEPETPPPRGEAYGEPFEHRTRPMVAPIVSNTTQAEAQRQLGNVTGHVPLLTRLRRRQEVEREAGQRRRQPSTTAAAFQQPPQSSLAALNSLAWQSSDVLGTAGQEGQSVNRSPNGRYNLRLTPRREADAAEAIRRLDIDRTAQRQEIPPQHESNVPQRRSQRQLRNQSAASSRGPRRAAHSGGR